MDVVLLCNETEYSAKILSQIKKMNCNLYVFQAKGKRMKNFPKQYDLGISFLYPFRVPPKEIDKSIWINFHPAILPNYGGRNVAYHAIINEEEFSGGSLHYMDKDFDSGDIIDTIKFKINDSMTAKDVFEESSKCLVELFGEYIPRFLNNEKILGFPQEVRTYYRKNKINDYIEIDNVIKKHIRALTYPPNVPKIKIGGKIYKIIQEIDGSGGKI